MSNSEERETNNFVPQSSLIPTTSTPTVVAGPLETQINLINSATDLFGDNSGGSSLKVQSIVPNTRTQYYQQVQPQKLSDSTMNKTGDFSGHRPIIQSNMLPATYKITQVGPVIGSNVVVSKMENSIQTKPTGTNLIPTSGPLSNPNSNYYFNNNNNNNNNSSSSSSSNSTINHTKSNTNLNRTVTPRGPSTSKSSNPSSTPNFYHTTANNVTKFTNMIVGNVSAKNPLKPNHFTLPNNTNSSNNVGGNLSTNGNVNGNIMNLATHPNHNLTAPNTSGIAPKTTLRASDLIHILPNLFNTLKRRNSQSGNGANNHTSTSTNNQGNNLLFNGTGNATASNSLAAAVAAAASNSGKPMSNSTAAALVAEQLLNVAASGSFSDDSSSPPPQHPNYYNSNHQNLHNYSTIKRFKLNPSALQCEICGKIYKHRNCLSKHMWEHHESWEHTKKVCQTKHQQVQLLEAAQVLAELIAGVQSVPMDHRNNSTKSGENSGEDDNSEEDDDDDDGEVVDEQVKLVEEIDSTEIVNESVVGVDDNVGV